MGRRTHLVTLAVGISAVTLATIAVARPLSKAPTCPLFPADNPWNQRVDRLPVAGNSSALVGSIGLDDELHPDFGSGKWNGGPIGIPYTTVSRRQRRVPVSFYYGDESDPGPYPIPRNAPIEGGRAANGDRHVIVVDRDRCKLYEMYDAHPVRSGRRWRAGSGAVWSLRSNALRPAGWTSADAAGLPILPGLARYDEYLRGEIDHAIRFTAQRTRRAYVYPARHFASDESDPRLPPMGLRARLKSSVDISGFPPQARVILQALKRYGMILADNGTDWYMSGAPSRGWDNDDLHTLHRITGRNFEVVDTGRLPRPGS
jgi:hypothetical protein